MDKLSGKEFVWRLEGSANLMIQGMGVSIQDLDITTNDEDIGVFRDALNEFIVEDCLSERINGRTLICNINGFEVEVNSYGDRGKNMFDKTKRIEWEGLDVPVLPLEDAREFYRLIGREKKVKLIGDFLKSS